VSEAGLARGIDRHQNARQPHDDGIAPVCVYFARLDGAAEAAERFVEIADGLPRGTHVECVPGGLLIARDRRGELRRRAQSKDLAAAKRRTLKPPLSAKAPR
jgi:hypothetical protein